MSHDPQRSKIRDTSKMNDISGSDEISRLMQAWFYFLRGMYCLGCKLALPVFYVRARTIRSSDPSGDP